MKEIWRFTLSTDSVQDLIMPGGAEITAVGVQEGKISLWAGVIPKNEGEERTFELIKTGEPIKPFPDARRELLGMVQLGRQVYHVFEIHETVDF